MADPWALLGVPPGSGYDEARRAYLLRLQVVHPDRHQGASPAVLAEAERATRELNDAWEAVQGALATAPGAAGGFAPAPAAPTGEPLRWMLDHLLAAAAAEGDPLRSDEVDLMVRPLSAAPRGRRFDRWVRRRRATLTRAVQADGADAWGAALRALHDRGTSAVVLLLFEQPADRA
jgi:hypothetical protein